VTTRGLFFFYRENRYEEQIIRHDVHPPGCSSSSIRPWLHCGKSSPRSTARLSNSVPGNSRSRTTDDYGGCLENGSTRCGSWRPGFSLFCRRHAAASRSDYSQVRYTRLPRSSQGSNWPLHRGPAGSGGPVLFPDRPFRRYTRETHSGFSNQAGSATPSRSPVRRDCGPRSGRNDGARQLLQRPQRERPRRYFPAAGATPSFPAAFSPLRTLAGVGSATGQGGAVTSPPGPQT
jgi:hypothetical protein